MQIKSMQEIFVYETYTAQKNYCKYNYDFSSIKSKFKCRNQDFQIPTNKQFSEQAKIFVKLTLQKQMKNNSRM